MGFPDNYTNIIKAKKTQRYQATGNSWVVPVIKWIGTRLTNYNGDLLYLKSNRENLINRLTILKDDNFFLNLGKDLVPIAKDLTLNCTSTPENCSFAYMSDIVSADAPEDIYISPVGCYGIIRRKNERNIKINPQLETVLLRISSQMSPEEIEKRSRIQKRGRLSDILNDRYVAVKDEQTSKIAEPISLFKLPDSY